MYIHEHTVWDTGMMTRFGGWTLVMQRRAPIRMKDVGYYPVATTTHPHRPSSTCDLYPNKPKQKRPGRRASPLRPLVPVHRRSRLPRAMQSSTDSLLCGRPAPPGPHVNPHSTTDAPCARVLRRRPPRPIGPPHTSATTTTESADESRTGHAVQRPQTHDDKSPASSRAPPYASHGNRTNHKGRREFIARTPPELTRREPHRHTYS